MRVVGIWNAIILRGPLTAVTADAIIAEQVAFFRSLCPAADAHRPARDTASTVPPGTDSAVEWKVYGHDMPADLGRRLAAAGFQPEEPETLMVFDLARGLPGAPTKSSAGPGVVVRRVSDRAGLADFTVAAGTAFGRDAAWQANRIAQYETRLTDPAVGLYVAYANRRPVASARVDFPPGRSFAGLWGGGTIPGYRGRGIYRALVRVRAEEARRRGYRYLRVDARDTSRPILERLGFIALTPIIEWRLDLTTDLGPTQHK
ncbi:MAG TPA: GNAT family N-acetyltransferase [bacterium]|nr:GNAT family N-acetyltransferase [bacterium]